MSKLQSFAALIALSLSYGRVASAATIGPVADLTISNADVTPDGYTRAAVVMNGQMPGPLITGNMVSGTRLLLSMAFADYGRASRVTTSRSTLSTT